MARQREVIGVSDHVPVAQAIPLGIQHMMSMFGSTVLVPILTGLHPSVAIMCSGIGTVCYLLMTKNKIPSYLGSSFAFISPIVAVGATQGLPIIRAGLEAVIPPLEYAVAGFSDLVLQVDFDLLEVLTQWNQMPTAEPYRKLDITRYISLISKMREIGFVLTREQELRAANIPFNETDDALRELFFQFLHRWQREEPLEQPGLPEEEPTLPELELYYRKLDLYFSFSKAFGCPVDEDKLYDSRERVAEEINEILLYKLRSNIRFCARCGKALSFHHRGRLCDACFHQERKGGPPARSRRT